MDISRINEFHSLNDVVVRPDQLLLDPKNPRLIVDTQDDIEYTNTQLLSPDIQDDILSKINKNEHHVADLINNIKSAGFISGTSPIIVKNIPGTDKYIVVEGNRRITAIKHLLSIPHVLTPSCLQTITRLNVKEFIYKKNSEISEDEIIDVILGKIHISGPVAWGAMEKAHYIFKTYIRELKAEGISEFKIDKITIAKVSEIYSFNETDIKKNLRIYRIYDQVKQKKLKIGPDRFTLIEMAASWGKLTNDYFGLNHEYHFSEVGVEKFYNLCVKEHCIITNPKKFKNFAYIYKEGNGQDISLAESGLTDIEELCREIKKRNSENFLADKLNNILSDIEKLNLSDFRDSDIEKNIAKKIIGIVNTKLAPIVKYDSPAHPTVSNEQLPETISEAVNMSPDHIEQIIKESLRKQPNRSYQKDKLLDLVLNHINIQITDPSDNHFGHVFGRALRLMLEKGLIEEYKTHTKTRLRLLCL